MTRRQGRIRRQLPGDLEYWSLIEKALDSTLRRIRFGTICEPVERQTT